MTRVAWGKRRMRTARLLGRAFVQGRKPGWGS